MKRIYILIVLLIVASALFGFTTSRSMGVSNSYLMRANGVDALYWNPANIGNDAYLEIPILNSNFNLTNNLFNQDLNDISGKYLTAEDKEDLLSEIDGHFVVEGSFRTSLLGITADNKGFGIGVNTLVNGKITEEFMRILLFGNESSVYYFTKDDFDYNSLSYIDFTYGMGGFDLNKIIPYLNKFEQLPEINYGFSFSFLTGIGEIKLDKFRAVYRSTAEDGLFLNAQMKQKESFTGMGMKANLSFSSQINEKFSAGMGFDNIAGFIKWMGDAKIREHHYWMNNVYISNIDEDLLSDEVSLKDVKEKTTQLPFIYRLGCLYDFGLIDISMDYSHRFDGNDYNQGRNTLAFATEFRGLLYLPIQMGINISDGDNEITSSYGIIYRSPYYEVGISMLMADTAFPSDSSKSISFGLHSQINLK